MNRKKTSNDRRNKGPIHTTLDEFENGGVFNFPENATIVFRPHLAGGK